MGTGSGAGFSLNESVLRNIFQYAKPLGHHEEAEDLNLGFGFLYYGLVRALRPRHIVVIGSGYGFSVICLALGQKDNGAGRLSFVDPSYSLLRDGPFQTVGGKNNWADPEQVRERFARFGLDGMSIDLAFVDGNHAYKHVRHDFLRVLVHSRKDTYILLHDTNLAVRELVRHAGVKRWLKSVRQAKQAFEVVDFPLSSGVAVVRVVEPRRFELVA